nr:malto-oligosyltrehalose trehalohydrolase [Gordonia soli]
MDDIRVWAPRAGSVGLRTDDEAAADRPMEVDGGGWWRVSGAAGATAGSGPGLGARYGFVVDGADPIPDPRATRLPDGVHGLAALSAVDPASRPDTGWTGRSIRGAVIYELHVGTFTPAGTLDAAIDRLDHLVDLGVDFVEVMPLNAFNGDHGWGYDGVGWFAVHEPYGGPDAFVRFIDACHLRGVGVVLDVVYNHLGPSGNYLDRFGPYLTEGATGWGAAVNLSEADSDEVRSFIVGNALRWFAEFGVDALRLDAVHALADHRAVHILEELAVSTDALAADLDRPFSLIAESDLNDPRMILARADGGYGLTAQWNDDVHHAIHAAVSGERQGYYADFGDPDALAKVFRGGFYHDGTYSSFRRRGHGRPIPTDVVRASSLVAFTCDHDQVGNRAIGDRPSAYLTGGQLAIKAALVLLSPFTAMLFMGEEWGADTPFQFFTSHPEPELGRATAEGRRAEFAEHGWDSADVPDPQAESTFLDSKLDWSEIDDPAHRRVLDFYRALIHLRRTEPDIARDDFASVAVEHDADAGWFVLHRGTMSVVCVLSPDETVVPITLEPVLAWSDGGVVSDGLRSPGHNVIVGRRVD